MPPMPSPLHAWRQRPRFWAGLLVLAVLWLTLWGQLHRTLHPAALGQQAQPEVLAASHLGHDEGGGLCQLLDHLSDGAAPLVWVGPPLVTTPPARWLAPLARALALASPRWCDVRAPPPS